MNKLFGYGRTRTRLSLILLSALAVLCLVIVSMCVFGNLNALATDNIAYGAYQSNTNLVYLRNYCSFGMPSNISNFEWHYLSNQEFSTYGYDGIYINLESPFELTVNDVLSLSDGKITINNPSDKWFELGCIAPATIQAGLNYQMAIHVVSQSENVNLGWAYRQLDGLNTSPPSNYQTYSDTYQATAVTYFATLSGRYSDTFYCLRVKGGSITFDMCALYNTYITQFLGFVSNDFYPNGYNKGYDIGWLDGANSEYEQYYSSIYNTGYNAGYGDGFQEGSSAFDQSADAVYDMRGHLALQFGLTQEAFDENMSYAYIAPTGSINQFFEYNGVYYGYSYVYINASSNNTFSASIEYNNSNGIPAWKVAERVSGTITVPYIYNNSYRLCVYAGEGFAPVFYSLTYPTIAVGEYSCFQIEVPSTSDIYLVGWNTTDSISVSGMNPYVYGFSPLGVYKYNNVSRQYSNGWRDGFNQGSQLSDSSRDNIYYEGYQDGLLHANDYTFMGLLGSVFDAPVSALKGLLNYEILGVNLYDFVLGLLSLAIILFVLRVFTRGL